MFWWTATPVLSIYLSLSSLYSLVGCNSCPSEHCFQKPSNTKNYIPFQMSNQEYKYFYEDEVYRITKKGSLQFGMVVENVRRI